MCFCSLVPWSNASDENKTPHIHTTLKSSPPRTSDDGMAQTSPVNSTIENTLGGKTTESGHFQLGKKFVF